MKEVHFGDLTNIKENKLLGSESAIYDCFYQNHFYLYKQPHDFQKHTAAKMHDLKYIINPYLITPKEVIYTDNRDIPIGYLEEYLEGYKSLYDFDLPKIEKIAVLKKVKEAIIAMHKSDIIHTDLHIANIMYGYNDIKIIDFDTAKYLDYKPQNYNHYSLEYININNLSESVDIYNFNIDTLSTLYNIAWNQVFRFDYLANLTDEQNKVWQKTKQKEELTYDDFLIDRF